MPLELSTDLHLLVWSVALCVVQMLIAVIGAQLQVGLPRLAGNREALPEIAGWAGRAARAHRNMLENLVLFAVLVLVAQVAGLANETPASGRKTGGDHRKAFVHASKSSRRRPRLQRDRRSLSAESRAHGEHDSGARVG